MANEHIQKNPGILRRDLFSKNEPVEIAQGRGEVPPAQDAEGTGKKPFMHVPLSGDALLPDKTRVGLSSFPFQLGLLARQVDADMKARKANPQRVMPTQECVGTDMKKISALAENPKAVDLNTDGFEPVDFLQRAMQRRANALARQKAEARMARDSVSAEAGSGLFSTVGKLITAGAGKVTRQAVQQKEGFVEGLTQQQTVPAGPSEYTGRS